MDQSPTPSPITFTPSLDQRTTYVNALIWFGSAMTLCSVMLMTIFFSFWKRNGQFTTPPENQPSGLDRTVLNSIPVFVYSSPADDDARLDCSVCLGEFKEREKGRSLPGCGHSFHVECVDMWFRSHSTCPLCRSTVGVGHWNDGLKQGTDLA